MNVRERAKISVYMLINVCVFDSLSHIERERERERIM